MSLLLSDVPDLESSTHPSTRITCTISSDMLVACSYVEVSDGCDKKIKKGECVTITEKLPMSFLQDAKNSKLMDW